MHQAVALVLCADDARKGVEVPRVSHIILHPCKNLHGNHGPKTGLSIHTATKKLMVVRHTGSRPLVVPSKSGVLASKPLLAAPTCCHLEPFHKVNSLKHVRGP